MSKRGWIRFFVIFIITASFLPTDKLPANAATYTSGTITTDTDFYLTVTANTNITVAANGSGDPTLWLYDSSGAQVAYNDDSRGLMSDISYAATTSGPYRLRAGRCCSLNRDFVGTSYTVTINLTGSVSSSANDVTAPTISTVIINANAGADSTYIAGDVITATVTWSENVTITGSPRIPIQGLTSKYLTYSSGSGSTSTTFTYSVASGDNDSDGIAISLNTLELNSGTIKDAANNAASLSHSAVSAATTQKIDTTSPSYSSATTNSSGTQIIMTYGEALSSTTAATSTFAVLVAGISATVSSVSVSGSTVVITLAAAVKIAQTVTVGYTDPTSGNDANAIQDIGGNDASTLSATSVTNISTVKQSQASLSLSGGSTRYGVPLLLQASGGSGTGSLSYAVVSGPCTISNVDSLTATGQGTCLVTATRATDSTYLSATSSSASYTISVGLSSATVSLTPGTFIYRQSKNVIAVASVAGKITFKVNDEFVAGCRNLVVNLGNNFTATCPYKPSVRGSVMINVVFTPSDSNYLGTASSTERFFIYNRTGNR